MNKHFTITAIVFLASASMLWAGDFPVQLSSFDTELKNDYAITTLGDYYVTGIGLGIQADFDLNPIENLGVFVGMDYKYGISRTVWVDSFQDISLIAGASYVIGTGGALSFIPELGYGLCTHLLPGDIDRDGTDSASVYFDQILTFSIKAAYALNEVYSIYFSPDVKYYIESEQSSILAGYNLGASIKL